MATNKAFRDAVHPISGNLYHDYKHGRLLIGDKPVTTRQELLALPRADREALCAYCGGDKPDKLVGIASTFELQETA